MADATYIEPLNVERLEQIIAKERPDALLPNLGGQTGLNLATELSKLGILDKYGVKVVGVNLDAIQRGEDREVFKETMKNLGIETPKSGIVHSVEEAKKLVLDTIGFPVVVTQRAWRLRSRPHGTSVFSICWLVSRITHRCATGTKTVNCGTAMRLNCSLALNSRNVAARCFSPTVRF